MINEFKILNGQDVSSLDLIKKFAENYPFEIVSSLCELSNEIAIFEFRENKLLLNMLLDGVNSPLNFDLDEGSIGYRGKSVSKNNELIARAIGVKSHYRPIVLDATAGMGRDSYIMAKLGCQVIMQERCLPIYCLLENALSRLFNNQPEFKNKISLQNINSVDHFTKQKEIDVIYLDPMFPARKKSALVKKEMRLFKILAGEDLDADRLFKKALDTKAKRVVVKRPKGAPQLLDQKPSHEITSKGFRFDVYLN